MSKTIIEVKCIDQVLTLTNTPVIASGGVGEDFVRFDLCEMWDGFAVSAIFWRKGVDCIPVLLDAENTCQVPPELMTSEGIVYFGVAGVATDGTTRTSNPVSYLIQAGTITENTALPIPGEDVFKQLMSYYADVKLYVSTRIDEAADAAVQAGKNAQAADDAAAQAESHAKAAVEAVDGVIYPGIPASVTTDKVMTIALDRAPKDKMVLVFTADVNASGVDKFQLEYETIEDGLVQVGYALSDGYDSPIYWQAFNKGDHVTVLLTPADKMATILNPRITSLVRDELNAQAARVNEVSTKLQSVDSFDYNGRLGVIYKDSPVDGAIVRFKAVLSSDEIVGLHLAGGIGYDLDLVDADGNSACNGVHTFSAGSYVAVLLDMTNLKAYILNPAYPGVETVKYTGGEASIRLYFNRIPKVIYLMNITNISGSVSAVLIKDLMIGKLSRIVNGSYNGETVFSREDKVISLDNRVAWGRFVIILPDDDGISANLYNQDGCEYVAIGIM